MLHFFHDTQHDFQTNVFQLEISFVPAPPKTEKVHLGGGQGGWMDGSNTGLSAWREGFISCVSLLLSQTM